ncbi:MAG: aspartate carbamoyltransferase regulatory subunit [Bacteroidales bacterium]|jgi:aspartate carbamoyltransferase regulatory subunit|nr:aspartate carbamoyltransferase regulatory subunit [Bacteroidales bacterium]MBQ3659169.1 aspartate carbamoyltransferase regulatory subunit [Bacteroidales bacterium]MBQ5402658.1 aspartate carbamoyltransferase regulatory subunit [Bacteroidales bacterium]MBQ6081163.1 aspartate carbamoyltransferase regulatory subunit [Bacteroidales bacterium]MBQ7457567.1 aspartate carbamoyltransferase regulatory subunit [Bacteroidales bacterium]
MSEKQTQLKVSAIKDGTVLDHIPAQSIFQVIDILDLAHSANPITIGSNLESKTLGRKGIIKIADRFFEDAELSRIALAAPDATVNVIKDYEVVQKKKIELPETIVGIAKCSNPMCVTNHQSIPTRFSTVVDHKKVKLLCHYCEKTTEEFIPLGH